MVKLCDVIILYLLHEKVFWIHFNTKQYNNYFNSLQNFIKTRPRLSKWMLVALVELCDTSFHFYSIKKENQTTISFSRKWIILGNKDREL